MFNQKAAMAFQGNYIKYQIQIRDISSVGGGVKRGKKQSEKNDETWTKKKQEKRKQVFTDGVQPSECASVCEIMEVRKSDSAQTGWRLHAFTIIIPYTLAHTHILIVELKGLTMLMLLKQWWKTGAWLLVTLC